MDLQTMLANIEQIKNDELNSAKEYYANLPDEEASASSPVEKKDVYKSRKDAILGDNKKSHPNGSSAFVKSVARAVVTGEGAISGAGLIGAYRRAKDDSDSLKSRGENDRAELVRNQYMEENFLPAVEAVVAYSSPDEFLNNKEALSLFDKYVLGVGRSNGYTASYLRTAYGKVLGSDLGKRFNGSDAKVAESVMRIKALCDSGNIRTAVGIARRMRKLIDEGENIASEEDYGIIGRVAAYGS